jgi:heme-degrading monooxygenase HmoA
MYAVVRETSYSPDKPIYQSEQFRQFQQAHSRLHGYGGTIVVDAGSGRFITLTLWNTLEDMTAARKAIGPIVERLLNPLMNSPAKLLGTGSVVLNDVT